MNPKDPSPPLPGKSGASPAEAAWRRLVLASLPAHRDRADNPEAAAPFGFATRVVAQWSRVREQEKRLALWQRWSWRAAVASLALSGVLGIVERGVWTGARDRPLLEPPAMGFPVF